jgi:hypothetical protein
VTAVFGERVLDWMVRRLNQAVRLEHDLVLIHDNPALADVPAKIEIAAEPWRVARITGELTLRDALPEADRLIASVPAEMPPLPMDIAARTYLQRILDIRSEDVVAALSTRFCEALVDESLSKAVFESIDTLVSTAERWSLGSGLVTAREVRSMLVGAQLGAARLDRERDWELLARWILEGAPTFRVPTLVRAALEEAQPRTGALLGWALTDGSLELLCTAGALLASPEGAALAPTIPGLAKSDSTHLIELVDTALREVWRQSQTRASEVLGQAERTVRQAPHVSLDAGKHRLLRIPLETALSQAANRAAEGNPPDDVTIESLKRNLHAPALAESINAVADLARLARFNKIAAPSTQATQPWFEHALRDVAWSDLASRRVKRALTTIPAWLSDPAKRVLDLWTSKRDRLNQAFAGTIATHWAALARNTDTRQALPLHQLSRCIVRRLLDDGGRVLLVVLDGCDLASWLEIIESLPADARIGLSVPEVRDAVLRDDLSAMGAFSAAVSAIPTVTNHARRALFAGEIPGNTALDDTESAAANATADAAAWKRNTALGDTPRQLFLKGELGTTGQPLLDALRSKEARLLGVVFNGVDDALSSKETTLMPRWSLAALGAGAAEAIPLALDEGWTIIVTADHGHTPFVSSDRKVAGSGLGHRFAAEPGDGTVAFANGPLPKQPLHLLARFGAWYGHQRRGFHGGASIEEVAVPLAFLGRVRGPQEGRPRAPSWWWTSESHESPDLRVVVARPEPEPAAPKSVRPPPPPRPAAVQTTLTFDLDPRLESLSADEKAVMSLLATNQSVRLSAIALHTKRSPMRASGFMQQLVRKLHELGVPCVTVELPSDNDRLYRYSTPDRGSR